MRFDRKADIGYARTLHTRYTIDLFFCTPLLNATASFTKRIIKNPSPAEVSMPLTSTRPSDAPPEEGNKTLWHMTDDEGGIFTRSKDSLKRRSKPAGGLRQRMMSSERSVGVHMVGQLVGLLAVWSQRSRARPRLTAKSSHTISEPARCRGGQMWRFVGQVHQMSTFQACDHCH